jgi:hypothetical protein
MRVCLAAVVALALAGCSDLGAAPPTISTMASTSSKLAQAQRTHEYPSSTAPVQAMPPGDADPVRAIDAFASAYINWSWQTVASDMRALAAGSVDQARAVVALAAIDSARDYELRRGGIANSGSVQAIAPLRGARDRYVVVTLERTTATNTNAYQGLRPAWHVAIATVTKLGGGWVVSGWQPEN